MDFVQSVRATLLYFDIFDYPLTADELFRYHPSRIPRNSFNAKLKSTGLRPVRGYYHLRQDDGIVELRQSREKSAGFMLLASKFVGKLVKRFPFVRGVFLSGSLSKGVNDGNADVDLFIISAEDRLWICRALLTTFKKTVLFGGKKFLCLNYFVTEDHLEIPDRNIFTATELVTLRPLYNKLKLLELLRANRWIIHFYPNFVIEDRASSERGSHIQRLAERVLRDPIADGLDVKLLRYYSELWQKRYPATPHERISLMFRSTPYSSKMHPNDFQTKILKAFEERLDRERIERLTRLDD